MPPKKSAVDELKSSEIRKLIKAHNKLMSIDIPKGTDREGLIKLVNDNGYKVDHKAKKLVLVQGGGNAMKRKPRVVNMPKEKTEAEKEEMKKKREANKMKKKQAEADLIKKGSILGKIVRQRQDRKGTHKMPDGTVMSGTKHNSKSVVVKSKPKSSPKKKVVKKVKRLYPKENKTEKKTEVIKRKLKGRLKSVRQETTEELEKLFPEFFAEDRELSMRTMGYVRDVLSVYQKIKSIGTTTQKTEARKIYEMFSAYRGDDKSQFDSYKKKFESILTKPQEPPKKVEPKKEVAKLNEVALNTELDKLVMKLENPIDNLKPVKARKETLYAVSVLLLNKQISFEDFRKIIDAISVYDSEFGVGFQFSLDVGQAPPKWRKKLSILIRKGLKSITFGNDGKEQGDLKEVWKEWTDMIPKNVKTEPTGDKKAKSEDTIKKQFEESKKIIKEFETLNKGFEKKDFSKLKKRYDYEQIINYNLFIKGANMMLRLNREKLDDDMDKKVKEQVKKNNLLKRKIDTIYKERKK